MKALDVLQYQLYAINAITHDLVSDLTEHEWSARATPNSNPIGFVVWHTVRQQDNTIQTMIRGMPEIIAGERWKSCEGLASPGSGAGFAPEEAERLARSARPSDVLEYADAALGVFVSWLGTLTEADLDSAPDIAAHLAPHPEYQRPGYREEVESLYSRSVGKLLASTCVGHIRAHLGEVETLKNILRASPDQK